MRRAHGFVVSLLLAAGTTTGAYALIETAHLGGGTSKPELATNAAIAKRAAKLDRWEVSLHKALATKTPALPAVPQYASITWAHGPGAASLPGVAVQATKTKSKSKAATPQKRVAAAHLTQGQAIAKSTSHKSGKASKTKMAPISAGPVLLTPSPTADEVPVAAVIVADPPIVQLAPAPEPSVDLGPYAGAPKEEPKTVTTAPATTPAPQTKSPTESEHETEHESSTHQSQTASSTTTTTRQSHEDDGEDSAG